MPKMKPRPKPEELEETELDDIISDEAGEDGLEVTDDEFGSDDTEDEFATEDELETPAPKAKGKAPAKKVTRREEIEEEVGGDLEKSVAELSEAVVEGFSQLNNAVSMLLKKSNGASAGPKTLSPLGAFLKQTIGEKPATHKVTFQKIADALNTEKHIGKLLMTIAHQAKEAGLKVDGQHVYGSK